MEEQLPSSPKICSPSDIDDVKYVSGLSTILVATIQEAKDRISQIEYIFCSQLFPNFQSKSRLLQKIYSEAKRVADGEWKEKENDLLLQIERLKLEKQRTLEANKCLELEKALTTREQEEKMFQLHSRFESQQRRVDELELKVLEKSKEIDEGMKLQTKLLLLVQSKASEIASKGKQLKEHEERTNALLAQSSHLEKRVNELQKELRDKTEEVAKGKELKENLFKKIESQASEIMSNEHLLSDQEKENKVLKSKLQHLEETVHKLQMENTAKTREIEEGRRLQRQYSQKTNLNGETLKRLEEGEKEKIMLLAKISGLEDKINELQIDLSGRTTEVAEGRDLYKKSLEHIELKTSELLGEKKKRRDVIDAYKRLKSQYNFLCTKFGLTKDSMLTPNKLEDETDSVRHNQNQPTPPGLEDNNRNTSPAACDNNKAKNVITFNRHLEDEEKDKPGQPSSSHCPSTFSVPAKSTIVKPASAPVVGTKRLASWRDTRSHHGQNGHDPHDDFLDTPLENIRENLKKSTREEACDHPVAALDKDFESSDDETQDVSADIPPQKDQMPVPATEKKGFKFIGPVRKKADRQNLKGIECKQCKKFYDAVLCDDEGKETNNNNRNFRCEHHDGVSRHRYKNVPPMTPEGFWNIGFESEMES
ncbi:hypothetical protein UlMin_005027 [Ulmus minor]